MASKDFDYIWSQIRRHSGETFRQLRGKPFTYTFHDGYIELQTTNQNISKADFSEAFELMPLKNTIPVQHLRGPSCIYAILMDKRIWNV
jgi:hypothetical protein